MNGWKWNTREHLMGKTIFKYTIYGDCASKKNNKRIVLNRKTNKPMVISSKKAIKWYTNAIKQMQIDHVKKHKFNDKLNAKILIYRKDKRGGPGDLNNFIQAPLDLLVSYGVIEDDNRNIIYSTDGSRLLYDKENPRVEVELSLVD